VLINVIVSAKNYCDITFRFTLKGEGIDNITTINSPNIDLNNLNNNHLKKAGP